MEMDLEERGGICLGDDDEHSVDIDAQECPPGCDPALWRRRNYTFGLRNTALVGMVLVSLLFAAVAASLLLRRHPDKPPLQLSVSVVWTVSLLLCSYFSFWIYTLSRTMGAIAILFRVSYGALLAFAGGALFGPTTGATIVHLNAAWTAGLLGYSLAQYRLHTGSELAADEAAARTPPSRSEGQTLTVVHCVFTASLVTLALAARVVWLVFFPSYSDENSHFMVMELSILVWTILYFWAMLMVPFLLHEALVSMDFMMRLYFYYIASTVPSIVCLLVSTWLFAYYFGMQMMAMAAFFGYILAVHEHCKDILARDKPLLTDLELGDLVQEADSHQSEKTLDLVNIV
ncbi:hypothetical protein ACP70R_042468 [Stipagrostis hirtigluma subsp. patula]